MHFQLLVRLKSESKYKTMEGGKNCGALPSSQHFEGVEGRVGTPEWD
jgi:hypothetical protein